MFWRSTLLAVLALALIMVDDSFAQRGGRGGGGRDRGGDRGSRDRGGDRGSQRGGGFQRGGDRGGRSRGNSTSAMLQALDRNGNGQLDPSEMQGTAGRFVEPMLRNAGINTGRAISIQDLERLAGGGRDNNSRDRNRGRDNDGAPLLLGFGNEFQDTIVPGFGPMDADVAVALNEEYDERTIRRVDFFLDRADTNHNGVLDRNEWEGLGGRYDTSEADKNNDGRITRLELAAQMEAESERDDERRDRGRDRGRGDDDDDDRRPSFGFGGRGGDFGGRGGFGGDRGDRGDRGDFGGRGGRGGRGRGGFEGFEGGGEWEGRGGWDRGRDDDDDDEQGRGRDRWGRGGEEEGSKFRSADHDSRTGYGLSGTEIERGTPSEFGQMDSNGDGQISMNEFLALDPQALNARAADFERMDTNGDGILGSREYNVGTAGRSSGGSSNFGGGRRPSGRDRGSRERGDDNNDEDRSESGSSDSGGSAQPDTQTFGRGPQAADTSSSSSSTGSASSASSDRYLKFAQGMVSQYDRNNNNSLEPDEFPETKMVDLNSADTDGNGRVTAEEIAAAMQSK